LAWQLSGHLCRLCFRLNRGRRATDGRVRRPACPVTHRPIRVRRRGSPTLRGQSAAVCRRTRTWSS